MGVGLAMGQQLSSTAHNAMQPTINTPAAVRAPAPPPIPPSAAFFMAVNGKPEGPFDLASLRQRAASGSLTRDTLLWRDGMAQWAAASTIGELSSLFA